MKRKREQAKAKGNEKPNDNGKCPILRAHANVQLSALIKAMCYYIANVANILPIMLSVRNLETAFQSGYATPLTGSVKRCGANNIQNAPIALRSKRNDPKNTPPITTGKH